MGRREALTDLWMQFSRDERSRDLTDPGKSDMTMEISAQRALAVWERAELLHSAEAVDCAMDQLAGAISARLAASDPVVLVVMTGAVVPAGLLLPRLRFPLRLDYLHVSRYRGRTSGGELHWIRRPGVSLADQSVLVVDDILDEGVTLTEIVRSCREAGAREVLSVVLVEKKHARSNGFRADFVGLQVPDRYVFGFGMDYKGYLRNANAIYAVDDQET